MKIFFIAKHLCERVIVSIEKAKARLHEKRLSSFCVYEFADFVMSDSSFIKTTYPTIKSRMAFPLAKCLINPVLIKLPLGNILHNLHRFHIPNLVAIVAD